MNRKCFLLVAAIAAIVVSAVGQHAQAGRVVWADFEGVMSGSRVHESTATGGAWQDGGGAGVSADSGTIQDGVAGGFAPAANGGSNYLRVSDTPGGRDSILDFDASVISQLTAGADILLEWDQYYIGGFPQPFLLDNSNPVEGRGEFQYEFPIDGPGWCPTPGNGLCYRDTSIGRKDSGLVATPNTWEHFSFRNVIGSGTATIGLGGNSVTVTDSFPLNSTAVGNGQIGQIWATISSGADLALDNISLTIVPEPTALLLSVLGGMGLLVARRRS